MQSATRKSRFQAIIDLVKGAASPGLFPRGKGDMFSNAMSAKNSNTLLAMSELGSIPAAEISQLTGGLKNPPSGAGRVDPGAR